MVARTCEGNGLQTEKRAFMPLVKSGSEQYPGPSDIEKNIVTLCYILNMQYLCIKELFE